MMDSNAPTSMQTQPVAAPVPPAPAAPPLGPALPMPAPAPTPTPEFEKGGDVGGGNGMLSKLTSGVNMIDVVIMSFFVGGTIYFLHVYKKMMQLQMVGYNDLSARMVKLEAAAAAKKAEEAANATGRMKRKFPVLRIS